MRTKLGAILRIIIFSIIAIVLIRILTGGIGLNLFSKYRKPAASQSSGTVISEGTPIHGEDVEKLDISWVAGDVRIVPGAQEEITVTEDRLDSDQPMVLRRDGSRLVVEFCESSWYSSLSTQKKDLTVTVPAAWSGKTLKVNLVSAGLTCTGLDLEQAELSTVSGACTLRDCTVGTLKMEAASGNLNFTGALRQLKFDGVSARANLTVQEAPEGIKMNSVSGNLDLTLPAGCGFTLDNSTISGRLDTDFPTAEQGGKTVSGDGACEIELNGVSASAHIRQEEQ